MNDCEYNITMQKAVITAKERLLPPSTPTSSKLIKQNDKPLKKGNKTASHDCKQISNNFCSLNAASHSDTSSSFSSSRPSLDPFSNDYHHRQIVRGNLNKISNYKQALVTLYFSSNPLDSSLECAVLWERAVPSVREFCRENYDIEFQVVDLNAGFDNGLLLSNEKRLLSIERCQETSISAAFISLLGHKYWTPSIPSEVDAQLFEILLKEAYDCNLSNCRLFEENYERNENSIPPSYVLKYDNHAFIPQAFQVPTSGTGNETKAFLLQNLFRDSATHALKSKRITREQADVFLVSYLEEEIRKGILNTKENHAAKSVCYIRTINSMETDMNYGRICDVIDVLPMQETSGLYVTHDMLDGVAQAKLNHLRETVLPNKVVSSEGRVQVYKCAVTWMPQVGLHNDTHCDYLDDFNEQLQQVVRKMTTRAMGRLRKYKFESEIMCHSHLATSSFKSSFDFGQNELYSVKDFFDKNNSNYCILHGCKGSGKTHLIARVAVEVRQWMKAGCEPICVVRFLGQTFLSSFTILMLDSINRQLELCFGAPQEEPGIWCTDLLHQKKRLEVLLEHASAEEPIIILLDGLDYVEDIDEYRFFSECLPTSLSKHVKIVVTFSTNSLYFQGIFHEMKKLSAQFIEVKGFSPLQSSKTFKRILADQNRQITSGQLVFALQNLSKGNRKDQQITSGSLNLVLMHAVGWRSSKNVTSDTLGKDESSAVHNLMLGLQVKYGAYFVRITASLICISKFGITQQELEEILLEQKSAVNDVKSLYCDNQQNSEKASRGKTQEICGALANTLHSLLADLSFLLVQKLFFGCVLYTWSSRHVKNFIEDLYFSDPNQRRAIRKMLVRYYVEYVDGGSYTSNQEVPFKTVHVAVELPFHLKDLSREADVMDFCFLNIHWLTVIVRTQGIVPILFLLERAHKCYHNNRPLMIVERAIRLTIDNIKNNPNILPGEMLSRTLPFTKIFLQLRKFSAMCSATRFSFPYLLPAGLITKAPGAPLRVSFFEEQKIVDHFLAYESNKMANLVYCTENRLKFFDMVSGDTLREIEFNEKIKWLQITKDKQFILVMGVAPTHNLVILNEETSIHQNLSLENMLGNDEDFDSVTGSFLLGLWIRQKAQTIFLLEIKSGKFINELSCNKDIHSCLISSDDQFLFAVTLPQSIHVFCTTTGQMLCTLLPQHSLTSGHLVNVFESYNDNLLGVFVSGHVIVWERTQFTQLFELDSRSSSSNQQHLNVIHSSMSEDRSSLVLVKPTEIDVWDLTSWKTTSEISPRKDEHFASAYFCNDQKYLLVTIARSELSIYVWDLTSIPPTCISIIDGHTAALKDFVVPAFNNMSPAVPWVVTSSKDNSIKVWNLENLPLVPTLTMTGRAISEVFFVCNHTVTTDMSDTATMWRTSNADIVMQFKHSASVVLAAVSNWNQKLVTVDENNFQYVWDLRTGENLLKIHGPEVVRLLITRNDHLVVSIFQNSSQSNELVEASKIWRLNSGQVVCSFVYDLESAQVTSNNTFLVGISTDKKLIAISLWTGKLGKVLCRPGATVKLIHALTWHDHVLTLDSQNFVTIWNIVEETSLMSLDMKDTAMSNVLVCNSGTVLTTTSLHENSSTMKVLNVTKGKLRKVETLGLPLMAQLSWDGIYLIYISIEEVLDKGIVCRLKYRLVVAKLSESSSFATYPIEGVPTCLKVAKSGRSVAVGLEEGRPVVFNIIDEDSKKMNPLDYKFKSTERRKFYPKQDCDQKWFSSEPRYDERHVESTYSAHAGVERHLTRQIVTESSLAPKYSVHMPRGKIDLEGNKTKVKHRMGNKTSRVKVFM